MSEPPKPITRLAVPIDRAGPRGRNRLGDAALGLAMWTLPATVLPTILLSQLFTGHWADTQWLALRIGGVLLGIGVPVACAAAASLAAAAFVSAADRHLTRKPAIAALIVTGLTLTMWGLWIGPSMTVVLRDLFG